MKEAGYDGTTTWTYPGYRRAWIYYLQAANEVGNFKIFPGGSPGVGEYSRMETSLGKELYKNPAILKLSGIPLIRGYYSDRGGGLSGVENYLANIKKATGGKDVKYLTELFMIHSHKRLSREERKNFQNQYLFTYVFLLHQKYMLYLFLTKISVDIDDDLILLEDYKRRLYEFDTKYIFAQISEVPQYQRFYEKVMKVFKIKEMFEDVQDPLSHLVEIQRLNNEARQQKHDHNINTALVVLSLLTIVSAVTDASGITSNLDWLLSPVLSKIIQIFTMVIVIITSILMIIRLLSIKNKY